MAKNKKRKFQINAYWNFSGIDTDFERSLDKLAKSCGGKESGSGCDFMSGQRDVGYYNFPTQAKAEKAAKLIRAALENTGHKGIEVTAEEDDG